MEYHDRIRKKAVQIMTQIRDGARDQFPLVSGGSAVSVST